MTPKSSYPFTEKEPFQNLSKLAKHFNIPEQHQFKKQIVTNWHSLNYQYCKKQIVLPLEKSEEGRIKVAMADPFDIDLESELRSILQCPLDIIYCPKEHLLNLIDQCFHQQEGATSKLIKDLSSQELSKQDSMTIYDLLDDSTNLAPSIKLLNFILQEAINQSASDIHFEPAEEDIKIRYRIDGVLQNRHSISLEYKQNIMSRIKIMAQLDIAEKRRPQDGRIKLRLGKREIDFRISTIPISNGERIVMRILDKKNILLGLSKIGMDPRSLDTFRQMIGRSEGIVLVTGPTGSGKTTTLYSAMSEIYDEALNIMTIEDPVEYKLPGIAQINVHPKINLTFSQGLRHILRQDPDVIMIGEIRDLETAQIAIQASLTGHLVLSTLHTNDAPSAITRLVDMGIEPYLLSSCIIGILAQRLIRQICPHCKEPYTPTIKELKSLGLTQEEHSLFYHGKGCSVCYGSGYLNRRGIYELLNLKGETKKLISQSVDSNRLRNVAIKEGLVTLRDQGKQLIKEGVSTTSEVLRVALGMEEF